MYKRKSLNFRNEDLSRAVRKAEMLKTRKSSRFKQLNYNRDLIAEEEPIESKKEEPRALLLLKWKQEKQLKKEMESKTKIKPFKVGKYTSQGATLNMQDKTSQNVKSSFINHNSTRNFNADKIVKSRLAIPKAATQFSKIPKATKQDDLKAQPSKIPNGSKQTSLVHKVINKVDKKPIFPTSSSEKICMKPSGLSQKTPNQESVLPKKAVSKLPNKSGQKIPPLTFSNIKQKGLAPPQKLGASSKDKICSAPPKFQKIPAPTKNQKNIVPPPKLNASKDQKYSAPPKFQKVPVPSTKNTIPSKPQMDIPTKNITTRKGYCFKKAVAEAHKQAELKSSTTKESSLNWDISAIKAKNSFAPEDFQFQVPDGLLEFPFCDDDEDPFEIVEQCVLKYKNRTSTPESKCFRISSCEKSAVTPLQISSNKEISLKTASPLEVKNSSEEQEEIKDSEALVDVKLLEEEINAIASPLGTESSCGESFDAPIIGGCVKIAGCENELLNILSDFPTLGESPLSEFLLKEDSDEQTDLIKLYNKEIKTVAHLKTGEETSEKLINKPVVENFVHLKITDNENEPDKCSASELGVNKVKDGSEEVLELHNERISSTDTSEEFKVPAKKSTDSSCKRFSLLKSVSTLNTIDEADDSTMESSKNDQSSVFTPRRSKRLSALSHKNANILSECIPEGTTTPRRSLRLQKMGRSIPASTSDQQKQKSGASHRHSIRLIDLNTPEKDAKELGCKKTDVTADFAKLVLDDSENLNPNVSFEDIENYPGFRPRKPSLLYTPENNKRNKPKKSIKGDLINFSPM